jgi:L-phenylalanine/L-methionine N-acetyltransferase
MDVVIRHVTERDLEAVHEILTSPHVVAGSLRVPFAPLQQTRERLTPARGIYQLVAEAEGRVVGFGELITFPDDPRERHVGDVNMVATHADWTGKGVGRALLDVIVELADNWLGLARLGLFVFTDNAPAIRLYERVGFVIEGTMPRRGFGAGGWMDAHLMGRLHDR